MNIESLLGKESPLKLEYSKIKELNQLMKISLLLPENTRNQDNLNLFLIYIDKLLINRSKLILSLRFKSSPAHLIANKGASIKLLIFLSLEVNKDLAIFAVLRGSQSLKETRELLLRVSQNTLMRIWLILVLISGKVRKIIEWSI